VLSFLKSVGGPGTWSFLGWCSVAGAFLGLVWPRHSRLTLTWFLVLGVSYLLMALPVVANPLADSLSPLKPVDAADLKPLDTLVVLDGDNRWGRLRVAVQINAAAAPREVWVLGNAWLLDPLLQSGVPWAKIKHDADAPTTRDQIAQLRALVRQRPGRTAVVVSRLQLPRVARAVKAAGLGVTLVPSPIDDEPPRTGPALFEPTYIALRVSRDALYERAALLWYTWRGWEQSP
jgi:uncharacterized SAM-binding protein YcdF (DUF218 family)